MDKKKLLKIIIGIIIIAIVIGILLFFLISNKGSSKKENNNTSTSSSEQDVMITLKKEKKSNQVVITADVSVENNKKIEKIILPDNSEVFSTMATFIVEENGKYEFKVELSDKTIVSKEIEVTELEKISSVNPYIPEGFSEVEGDVEKGFVIEDTYGNQYVWVPVENGKLVRNTEKESNYKEINTTTSALVNSVAKYYGFYIARYEASKYELDDDITTIATMNGKTPLTNITYTDAEKYAESADEAFGYKDCQTALVNSYSWDSTLSWIDKSIKKYSSSLNYGNYSGTIYPTGYTKSDTMNNICDLAGNVREWTTEVFSGTEIESSDKKDNENKSRNENITKRVVRGGGATLSRTPSSHIYYPENISDNYWGFRTILFK